MVLDFISKLVSINQIKLSSYSKIKYLPYQTINFYWNCKFLKFIKKSISIFTTTINKNQSPKIIIYTTNFKNNNFFSYYKHFTSKSWSLIGTPMPYLKYDLSSQNIWKADFIDLNSVSTFFVKPKKIKKIKPLKKLTKIFKNQQKFYTFNWSKYQCSHNNLLRKKFLINWKRYRFITTSNLYNKVKKRKRNKTKLNFVRNKLKNFFAIQNNKKKSFGLVKNIPQYYKKLPKNKFKRTFLATQNNLHLKSAPKLKNDYTHLKNYKLTQSIVFKSFISKRQSFLKKSLRYKTKFKIFKKIKNQNYVKVKTRRYLRRINKKFKKSYKLKTLYSLKIKQLYKTNSSIFKNKKLVLLRINESSKPKLFTKFKHSKPYNFTNLKKNTTPIMYPLLEIYLTRTLQPFTTYKIRNKKLQSFNNSFKFNLSRLIKSSPRQKFLITQIQSKLPSNKQTGIKHSASKYNLKLPTNYISKLKKLSLKNMWECKRFSLKYETGPTQTYLNKQVLNNLNTINKKFHRKKTLISFFKINFSKIKVNKLPKIINKVKLVTKVNYSFILKSPIIFFSKTILNHQNKPQIPKFIFKKTIFSFLKPNEIRQSLMDRKKQFYFYKTLFNQKIHHFKNTSFKPHKLKQLYLKTLNQNLKIQSLNLNNYFSTTKQINNISQSLNLTTSNDIFEFKGVNQLFQRSEVRIPRVRFKPGYQRIWRQSRTALKESLKIKFAYQKKLSRYLVKFFKKINYYAFSASEMSIEKTIIYSRLVPDISTLLIFTKQHFIYCNGKIILKLNSLVYENDLIQLIVSKWYYAAYRWISNWTLKRVKRYKRLLYRKGLSSRYKLIKQRKQKSFYVPYWIYLTKYDSSDIKSYLEVDYLTLSAVVVYNPFILTYHSPAETFEYRPTVYRLYNWKYIT